MNPEEHQARRWIGQVVCLALKDGRYYVGYISDIKNGEIILSGAKGAGKVSKKPRKRDKAKVSGLLGTLFGNPANSTGSAFPQMGGNFPFSGMGNAVSPTQQAPANPSGTAGGGIFGSGSGLGSMVGFLQKSWPTIKVGWGMLQYIMPLLGRFNI